MVGRWCALGVAAAMAVGAAACSGGGGQAAPPSTEASTTTTTSPPPTALTDEQAVLAAYQGYWDTWLAANDPPDPNHPGLERYYTGRALDRAVKAIRDLAEVGQAVRLPVGARYRHDAKVRMIADGIATVDDCSIDDAQLVGARDGFVLDGTVATQQLVATLVEQNGAWQVSNVVAEAEWDGVAGCAA